MANSKNFVFNPANAGALAAKIEAAGGPNIDPAQNSGQATAEGVTLGWQIDGNEITVTILDKPILVPSSLIWEKVGNVLSN